VKQRKFKRTNSNIKAKDSHVSLKKLKGTNNSDSIVLEKFDGGGPTAYTTKAKEVGAQYFELDNWDELSKMYSDKEIWKINEKFLDIQIGSGREI